METSRCKELFEVVQYRETAVVHYYDIGKLHWMQSMEHGSYYRSGIWRLGHDEDILDVDQRIRLTDGQCSGNHAVI